MNKKQIYPGAAVFLLLLFLACEMMGPEPETAPGLEGKALVRITIEAEMFRGRTVSPTVELGYVTTWKLEGGKSGENETPLGDFLESDREASCFYLEPGIWDFTLTGYNTNEAPILRGTLTGQNIALPGPINLSFAAAPILDSNENGTFNIIINLPPDHGITTVKAVKDGDEQNPAPTLNGNTVQYETPLAAGNYYFSFLLYKDDDLYGVVSEAVQVRANLRSETSYTLALTDLNRTFTISYHLDGGSGVTSPGYYRTADPTLTLTPPTKPGYDFMGWYDNPGYNGPPVTAIPRGSTGDKVFYAKWEARQFTINLGLSDAGDKAFTQETFTVYKSGGTGIQTVILDGTGYARPRWFVDGNPETTDTETAITINAADYTLGNHILSLEAAKDGRLWSKEIAFTVEAGSLRTVLFRNNDGTGAIHALRTLTAGAALGSGFPAAPNRTGYNFTGWSTQSGGGGAVFDSTTAVNNDATVYAQWEAKTYTVHFESNDGTGTVITKTVTVPATTISPEDFPPPPTRTNFNFAGWNTAANGSGTVFGQTTVVAGDIRVYALWARTQFAISLGADAGSELSAQPDNFTLYKSNGTGAQTVELAAGYTKPRWFVDGDPKGTEPSITIQAADYGVGKHLLTLIAARGGVSWSREIPFTVEAGTLRGVVFRSNDGGLICAIRTLSAGTALGGSFPADPEWSGYAFTGWNTQSGGGGAAFNSTTPVNDDTTVYAQWSPKTYTVTFDKNEGDTDASPTTKLVTRPDLYINALPAPPTRSGWNFVGWNTEADGSGLAFGLSTVLASDITVYAQWAHTQFGISLGADAGEDAALSQGDFTLSKSGGGIQISLGGTGYTNFRWFVDGDPKGTESAITIEAAEYGLGEHSLTLLVTRNGVSWSKEITFTVTN